MVDAEELVFYMEVGPEVLRDVQAHVSIRVFHKLDEIGNNANIGIRGFTTRKPKKKKTPMTKCYP